MKEYKKESGVEFYEYLTRYDMEGILTYHLPPSVEWVTKIIPPSYRTIFNKEEIYRMTFGASLLCPEQPVREGIVVRSVDHSNGRRILKWISEDYLDDKSNTDFH